MHDIRTFCCMLRRWLQDSVKAVLYTQPVNVKEGSVLLSTGGICDVSFGILEVDRSGPPGTQTERVTVTQCADEATCAGSREPEQQAYMTSTIMMCNLFCQGAVYVMQSSENS